MIDAGAVSKGWDMLVFTNGHVHNATATNYIFLFINIF